MSLANGEFMGEIWQHFVLLVRAKMPGESTREKRTAFCPSPIQNSTPKNYSRLSLNYGILLAGHSAVPRPLRQYLERFECY